MRGEGGGLEVLEQISRLTGPVGGGGGWGFKRSPCSSIGLSSFITPPP